MSVKCKRGVLNYNIVMLIIAVGGVILLLYFFSSMATKNFNPEKETMESYFNLFKDAIERADDGEVADFVPLVFVDNKRYFLVYFENSNLINSEVLDYRVFGGVEAVSKISKDIIVEFFLGKEAINTMCVCSAVLEQKDFTGGWEEVKLRADDCTNCLDLDSSVAKFGDSEGNDVRYFLLDNNQILISKKAGASGRKEYYFEEQ